MEFLASKLCELLLLMYQYIPNLGAVIIVFTFLIRGVILLFTFKSLKASYQRMGTMQAMNREMAELKKKYAHDQATLQAKQLELSKKYNLNPFAGCIPQLLQIFILIVFYQAINIFVGMSEINGVAVNAQFGPWNLVEVDGWHVLPILAGAFQMLMSLMITPGAQVRDLAKNDAKNKEMQRANEKEEDTAEMAATMQKQMMFLMPIMTVVIAWNLNSGVVLYWLVSTIFSIFQQAAISGWGRLKFWGEKEGKGPGLGAGTTAKAGVVEKA